MDSLEDYGVWLVNINKSLLMKEGMHSISMTCFPMFLLSVGFYSNVHNLLVNDKSLAGGLRFSLQFNNISEDLAPSALPLCHTQ